MRVWLARGATTGGSSPSWLRATPSRSTLHGALVRGYDATLVSDAHTTRDQTAWGAPPPDQVIAHTNLYWTYQTAPGRTAGTVETRDVDFGGTSLAWLDLTRPVCLC
jgi:hypothetical protein